MSTDVFGRAVYDHFHGEQSGPLIQRDGAQTVHHPIEEHYFGTFDPESADGRWLEFQLSGPLLDLGAGAGRDTLYFQREFETVAVEISEALVELMTERGVETAIQADMFSLRETFDRDQFGSILSIGTQLGLARSLAGIRAFLADAAHVTTPDATAVVDSYDPAENETRELPGYRPDVRPGIAYRLMTFEYDNRADESLLFVLVSPERLRETTVGTPWRVREIEAAADSAYYRAALEKVSAADQSARDATPTVPHRSG